MIENVICAVLGIFLAIYFYVDNQLTKKYRDSVISLLTEISKKVGK